MLGGGTKRSGTSPAGNLWWETAVAFTFDKIPLANHTESCHAFIAFGARTQ